MSRHCDVTGLPTDRCDCGAHDDDGQAESWRAVPFRSPGPAEEAP